MNTNKDFVSLLASSENVIAALEVIKAADDLQQLLFRRFWSQVEEYLRVALGNVPILLKARDRDWQYDGVNGWLSGPKPHDQQLFGCVEHMLWKDRRAMDLYLGLHWMYPVKAGSPELSLKAVKDLEEEQRRQGFEFDGNLSWLGWRYLEPRAPNPTQLLIMLQSDAAEIAGHIADTVAPWITARYELICRANAALGKAPTP